MSTGGRIVLIILLIIVGVGLLLAGACAVIIYKQ